MANRILLAAILGGLALFAWESVAHMLLPLGDAGIKALPSEQAVMTAIKDNVREAGFYFFPAPEQTPGMTADQKQQAFEKAQEKGRAGPLGIMIVKPAGGEMMTPTQLLTQLAMGILSMLIAAILLAQMPITRYVKRVVLVALMGLLPVLQVEIPHWNWYGFPPIYTLSQSVIHVVGFLLAGLVLAKIVAPRWRSATAGAPLAA